MRRRKYLERQAEGKNIEAEHLVRIANQNASDAVILMSAAARRPLAVHPSSSRSIPSFSQLGESEVPYATFFAIEAPDVPDVISLHATLSKNNGVQRGRDAASLRAAREHRRRSGCRIVNEGVSRLHRPRPDSFPLGLVPVSRRRQKSGAQTRPTQIRPRCTGFKASTSGPRNIPSSLTLQRVVSIEHRALSTAPSTQPAGQGRAP